jgi:hypothetical protein
LYSLFLVKPIFTAQTLYMEQKKPVTRKNFLSWGVALSGIIAFPAVFRLFGKKEKPTGTVKMLGQDGKLVEVDLSKIQGKGKKIKGADIHTWIKNKPS